MNDARERDLERSRCDLIAWAGCDLRAPLARIRAMIEALDEEIACEPSKLERYRLQLTQEADRMELLVDDLLELAGPVLPTRHASRPTPAGGTGATGVDTEDHPDEALVGGGSGEPPSDDGDGVFDLAYGSGPA